MILEDSHTLRPKVTVAELKVILEGLEKAGFDRQTGPRYWLFQRLRALSTGDHYKKRGRIWSLSTVEKHDELEGKVAEILNGMERRTFQIHGREYSLNIVELGQALGLEGPELDEAWEEGMI